MKKIASLVIALCVITFVSCSPREKTPSDTVKNYLECLQSGKYEKAISYYNIDLGESMEMKMLADKMEESLKEQNGLKSFKLVEGGETISEDGKTATVAVLMTHGNGDVEEEILDLVKVDGEWKLEVNLKNK
ncbi:MAG: DUF4878 domain-containing protein [Bacteroidales bacterium]|nr:DUF4878 domain-containing protein [Bacteroidales bacterium]